MIDSPEGSNTKKKTQLFVAYSFVNISTLCPFRNTFNKYHLLIVLLDIKVFNKKKPDKAKKTPSPTYPDQRFVCTFQLKVKIVGVLPDKQILRSNYV